MDGQSSEHSSNRLLSSCLFSVRPLSLSWDMCCSSAGTRLHGTELRISLLISVMFYIVFRTPRRKTPKAATYSAAPQHSGAATIWMVPWP
jgi:hypothetical protein